MNRNKIYENGNYYFYYRVYLKYRKKIRIIKIVIYAFN